MMCIKQLNPRALNKPSHPATGILTNEVTRDASEEPWHLLLNIDNLHRRKLLQQAYRQLLSLKLNYFLYSLV